MDKLDKYRQIIQSLVQHHGSQKISYGDVETQILIDKERDHYQVVHVGWDGDRFIHGCSIHIDIKGDKVWIQWNSTEDDIATDLTAQGIPKEDIVVGLHPPNLRKFTEYAVS